MTTRKKVAASPKRPAKKAKVSRPKSTSRPATKKVAAKKITSVTPKKKTIKTKPKAKPKVKTVKPVKIKGGKPKPKVKTSKPKKKILKSDTILSCHKCKAVKEVNFAFVWKNSVWPWCCGEGMHIENSSIKIGEVMNQAWVNSGGYAKNFTLK